MNTENSKTDKSHIFRLKLAVKIELALKNTNKNTAQANSSIYYTWKNITFAYSKTNSIYLLQRGMSNLVYLMDDILFQTLITIVSMLLKT